MDYILQGIVDILPRSTDWSPFLVWLLVNIILPFLKILSFAFYIFLFFTQIVIHSAWGSQNSLFPCCCSVKAWSAKYRKINSFYCLTTNLYIPNNTVGSQKYLCLVNKVLLLNFFPQLLHSICFLQELERRTKFSFPRQFSKWFMMSRLFDIASPQAGQCLKERSFTLMLSTVSKGSRGSFTSITSTAAFVSKFGTISSGGKNVPPLWASCVSANNCFEICDVTYITLKKENHKF